MQQGLISLHDHATPTTIAVGPLWAMLKVGGWAFGRAWLPLGVVCPTCFGSCTCDCKVGEPQSSMYLAKSDEGGIAAPSILLGSCEPLKHVHGTSLFVILGGTASEVRELVSLASDAHQVQHVMSSPADSLSRFGRGRHYKKNLCQCGRQ